MTDKTDVVFVPVTSDPTKPDWDPDAARLAVPYADPNHKGGGGCPVWKVPLRQAHAFYELVTRKGVVDLRAPSLVGGFGPPIWISASTYRSLVEQACTTDGTNLLAVYRLAGGMALVSRGGAVHALGEAARSPEFWPSAATDETMSCSI